MPRRLLGVRKPCFSWERLSLALEAEQERPSVDEIVESQDKKLQQVKRNVFNGLSGIHRLVADAPVLLSTLCDLPSPPLPISTHFNDNKQSILQQGGGVVHQEPSSLFAEPAQPITEADIDFSKPENLFLLEAPIDARKDQNMLKLAYTVPKRSFMSRILRTYPINRKRLAFIQRHPSALKSIEVVGNLIVSAKGGEAKEVTISCQVCGQKFSRQYQFQRHILIHPDPESKKFLCQICGKRFNRADHLNRHAILHGDVKVHKCLLCGEEFDRASHLDRHRRKHHPPAGQQPSQTPPSTPQMTSPPATGLSPSLGGMDGFVLGAQSSVDQQTTGHNLHLLAAVATPEGQPPANANAPEVDDIVMENGGGHTHLDPVPLVASVSAINGAVGGGEGPVDPELEPERPYPCDVCGRKFIRATHLRRHMRIHTGEKPFTCHICGRRYARGDYLRAHIHAHRRDKIHKCKHCGEVFHDLTRFADHCRLLHKDTDDEFGNPKPPPESSPPPPNFQTLLEPSFIAEEAEEITVIPSINMNMMDISTSVPITLVTLPETSEPDVICKDPPTISAPNTTSHTLPTPGHTPMTSPELQLTPLQVLTMQPNSHVLVPNGQLQVPNGQLQVANSANEVAVYGHNNPQVKTTPISYIDSVTQYIYVDNNSNHGNVTTIFPTPQHSPLVQPNQQHSSR